MRVGLVISLISTLAVSCLPLPRKDHDVALYGTAITGENLTDVCLFSVSGLVLPEDWEARAELNGQSLPIERSGNCYSSPFLSEVPQSGDLLSIDFRSGDIRLSVETVMPSSPVGLTVVPNVFSIQTNSAHAVATVQWMAEEGIFFLLKLEVMEDNPQLIPFSGISGGNFFKDFEGLVIQQGLTLVNTDFSYYGLHRITVYSFDKETAELISYLPQFNGGIITSPPQNINGGSGFLAGMGKAEVFFEILPE
jgi:hypothetical protein